MSQIITPVTQDFYRITEVFNDDLLHTLQEQFIDTSAWPKQPNIKGIRSYYNLSMEFHKVLSEHLRGVKKFIESVPLGRLAMPSDLGNAALYLCSDEADFITGVMLEIDGGRSI